MSTSSRQTSKSLPIHKHQDNIQFILETNRILILVGETGCGKSTQVPLFLHSSGKYNQLDVNGQPYVICVTQPRRIAAIQLAETVSKTINCILGSTVGYAVKFKDKTDNAKTEIKYVTEGVLLKEVTNDPLLTKYSVIVVDEIHERNVQTDLILGVLKCLLVKRNDLKIIICSATIVGDSLKKFLTFTHFNNQTTKEIIHFKPVVYSVPNKSYPVSIFYRKENVVDYVNACVVTAIKIHEANPLGSGKILIFLTGQEEVEFACNQLTDYSYKISQQNDINELHVIPLYASLDQSAVLKVFDAPVKIGVRICIVATNVAETSITINDVAFVVDCGYTKLRVFKPETNCESLVRVPISKASAKQRAGRAGRTRDGIVYRLYTEQLYDALPDDWQPEIQRCQLYETVLFLKSLGVNSISSFPLVSPMPKENLITSLDTLHSFGALNDKNELTSSGKLMSKLGIDPKLSRILISKTSSSCLKELVKIVAMLCAGEIIASKPAAGERFFNFWSSEEMIELNSRESDFLTYLNIFNAFIENKSSHRWAFKRNLNFKSLLNAVEISQRFINLLKHEGLKLNSCQGRTQEIQQALLDSLYMNSAYRIADTQFKTVESDLIVEIHPLSCLNELSFRRFKQVVFIDLLETTKLYMRHVMTIDSSQLSARNYEFKSLVIDC